MTYPVPASYTDMQLDRQPNTKLSEKCQHASTMALLFSSRCQQISQPCHLPCDHTHLSWSA
eukprot:4553501-Prorocentrum_lima.AAC.1